MNLKISLLVTLFIMSFLSLSAQVSIGFHGSYGDSWQNYSDNFTLSNGPPFITSFKIEAIESFQFNTSVYLQVSKIISIGLEPGYSRRGAFCKSCAVLDNIPFINSARLTFGPPRIQKAFYANYIELPLMVKAESPIFGSLFRVSGKIGLGPSYMIKGYTVWIANPDIGPEKVPVDFKSQNNRLSRWDLGVYSGLGIGYPIGRGFIHLEGKFYHGFVNSDTVFGLNPSTLNHSLRLGLGYTINL